MKAYKFKIKKYSQKIWKKNYLLIFTFTKIRLKLFNLIVFNLHANISPHVIKVFWKQPHQIVSFLRGNCCPHFSYPLKSDFYFRRLGSLVSACRHQLRNQLFLRKVFVEKQKLISNYLACFHYYTSWYNYTKFNVKL